MLGHVFKKYSVLFTKALPFTFLICGITATSLKDEAITATDPAMQPSIKC